MPNNYEKLINLIRSEGAKLNSPTLQRAEMTSANTCKVGELPLDEDDLVFLEHIGELKKGDNIIVYRISEDNYVILGKVR